MLKDTLDVTLNTTEFGSRLSLESMLGRYLTEDDSLLYIPGGSSVRYRLPPDRYLLSVRDTAETVSPCEIGFLIETAPPPPPPEWTKLMYYSPDVAGHNYVRSYTMLDAAGADAAVTVTHYDGLGRESQTVMTDGSPEGGDMGDAYRLRPGWTSVAAVAARDRSERRRLHASGRDRLHPSLWQRADALFPDRI